MERKTEYIPYLGRHCDIVELSGWNYYHYRSNEDESKLPRYGAWCKKCAQESAIPTMPIYMNGQPAYALKCRHCGSEYPMYKDMYIRRYIGSNTKNRGHINPTKGMMSLKQAMDRKARENHNDIEGKVANDICRAFGYTHEEYKEMKKEWKESERKAKQRFERETAEWKAKYREEKIIEKSEERKKLIQEGVIKYVKNIGLVDTRTNQVIKL